MGLITAGTAAIVVSGGTAAPAVAAVALPIVGGAMIGAGGLTGFVEASIQHFLKLRYGAAASIKSALPVGMFPTRTSSNG